MSLEEWKKRSDKIQNTIQKLKEEVLNGNYYSGPTYEDRMLYLDAAYYLDKYYILANHWLNSMTIPTAKVVDNDESRDLTFDNALAIAKRLDKTDEILKICEDILGKGFKEIQQACNDLAKKLNAHDIKSVKKELDDSERTFNDYRVTLSRKLSNIHRYAAKEAQNKIIKRSAATKIQAMARGRNAKAEKEKLKTEMFARKNKAAVTIQRYMKKFAEDLDQAAAEAQKENEVYSPKFEKTAEKGVRKIVDMLKDGFKEERERLQKALDDLLKRGQNCIQKFCNAIKEWLKDFTQSRKNQEIEVIGR